jgi:hypothetical protein
MLNIIYIIEMSGKKVNEEVIFDYKYNAYDNKYDEIKSYPLLQMESRRIFYCKIFNIMKYSRV